MTRKERLMATLNGEPVDRPAVCFYELDGFTQNENDPDIFNVFNHESWKPLLELVRQKTDRIVMCGVPFIQPVTELQKLTRKTTFFDEQGRRHEITEIKTQNGILKKHTRRDLDVDTEWTLEHLLKDEEDLEAWLRLPDEEIGSPDYRKVCEAEKALGDSGIVMLDTGDAVCTLADLLGMENFMVLSMTETELIEAALRKIHRIIVERTKRVAEDFPGHLWRIYGPEYACAPYLPPEFYKKFIVGYDQELVDLIHNTGGFVRIHQHGRQKEILDFTVGMGCDAIDPAEPVPHGDIDLIDIRKKYGKQIVIFGNIEISDIETMPAEEFERIVIRTIKEGTCGEGRGFVLMPTACPLGRVLSENTLRNYQKMVELAETYPW